METYEQASRRRARERSELGDRAWGEQFDEQLRADAVVRQRAVDALLRERFGDPATIDAERIMVVSRPDADALWSQVTR